VANHHDGFLARVFLKDLAKVGKVRLRAQARIQLKLAFISQFVSDQRCRLGGAFEGAGDDRIDLDIERRKRSPDIAALLDTLFVQSALLIFFRIDQMLAGAGVA